MNTLQHKINQEINTLPLTSQKEVLDFVLFLKAELSSSSAQTKLTPLGYKKDLNKETDNDFLSKNPETRQAIIDGLNTPLDECSEQLDW